MSAINEQVDGNHYKNMKIQPIELGSLLMLNGAQQLIIKYVSRYRDKNGIVDLNKAIHCCKLAQETRYMPFYTYPKNIFEELFDFILKRRMRKHEQTYQWVIKNYVDENNFWDKDLICPIITYTVKGEYLKAVEIIEELIFREKRLFPNQ